MIKVTAYTLRFRGPVSIFTGLGVAGLVDRMVARNQEGLPCIPGSTVKGRWRFFAERLLRTGPWSQDSSQDIWTHSAYGPLCKNRDTACTLCRLFGNPAMAAMLYVGQGELLENDKYLFLDLLKQNINPVVHPDAELRPGIALSRRRRVTLPEHLFFDEAIPAVHFRGPLYLSNYNPDSTKSRLEMNFLKLAGRLVDSLGARKAIGRGILENGIAME